MIRILVADDHAVVRRGVIQILSTDPDLEVVGEASTGAETMQSVHRNNYDLVLLDIGLPDIGGIEVLKQIHSIQPDLPVLILSIYPEQQYALRSLRAGASGYLTKESAPGELLTAVRTVLQGKKYLNPALIHKNRDEPHTDEEKEPHEALSDRELQVMNMIARGKRLGEIAHELSISVKTVSTYRSRVLEKLGIQTNGEMIRYALEHHLVE